MNKKTKEVLIAKYLAKKNRAWQNMVRIALRYGPSMVMQNKFNKWERVCRKYNKKLKKLGYDFCL